MKIALPFEFFGRIFYLFGGISILSILYFGDSFKTFIKREELPFRNITDKPLILFLIIILTILNSFLGKYLILSRNIFINLINIIYSIILGVCIIFMIFFINEVITSKIKCPLCEETKYIDENYFRKMEKCKSCNGYGYEQPKLFRAREFCKVCEGKGYIL